MSKWPKIPAGEPVTFGVLKKLIAEFEASWDAEDEKYLGKLEDQRIPVWIPGQGYDYAVITHSPSCDPFMLVPEIAINKEEN